MNPLEHVRRRWAPVATLAAAEIALAWGIAFVATAPLRRALASHPRGLDALFESQGRAWLDVARLHSHALVAVGLRVGLAVAAYALVSSVFAAFLPALFASPPATRSTTILAASVRRIPTMLAIAALSGVGYVLAGLSWWMSHAAHERRAHAADDPRVEAFWIAAALVVPAVCVALALLVADIARVHAMRSGVGSLGSMRRAFSSVRRAPLRTLGAFVPFGCAAAALAVGPLVIFPPPGQLVSGAVLAGVIALHHGTHVARVAVRALWFAHLAGRVAIELPDASES